VAVDFMALATPAENAVERAVAAASDAALPRSLSALRCMRQLLSVSVRSVGHCSLPLPDLQLTLLSPSPPADAQLEVRAEAHGGVRAVVRSRSLAERSDATLHSTRVARATLNPGWEVDGASLPPSAQRHGSFRLILRRLSPGGSAVVLFRTEVRLSSLVHIVERNSGGSGGHVGFGGAVGGLPLLPPCSVVIELDVGGGARRTFATRQALAPMYAAGLLVRLGPRAEGEATGAERTVRALSALELWAEAEAVPLASAAAEAEAANAAERCRLELALRSSGQRHARRLDTARATSELAALRANVERERGELARQFRAVDATRAAVEARAAAAARLAAAVEAGRHAASRAGDGAEAVAESALCPLWERRASTLRSAVFRLGRLFPVSAAAEPTLCGLRVGAREEETAAALGLAALVLRTLARLAGLRLGVALQLRGSRSTVREEEEDARAKPLPLHGKVAESGAGAQLLLREASRLVARLEEDMAMGQQPPAPPSASPGAELLCVLSRLYASLALPQAPKGSALGAVVAVVAPASPRLMAMAPEQQQPHMPPGPAPTRASATPEWLPARPLGGADQPRIEAAPPLLVDDADGPCVPGGGSAIAKAPPPPPVDAHLATGLDIFGPYAPLVDMPD